MIPGLRSGELLGRDEEGLLEGSPDTYIPEDKLPQGWLGTCDPFWVLMCCNCFQAFLINHETNYAAVPVTGEYPHLKVECPDCRREREPDTDVPDAKLMADFDDRWIALKKRIMEALRERFGDTIGRRPEHAACLGQTLRSIDLK